MRSLSPLRGVAIALVSASWMACEGSTTNHAAMAAAAGLNDAAMQLDTSIPEDAASHMDASTLLDASVPLDAPSQSDAGRALDSASLPLGDDARTAAQDAGPAALRFSRWTKLPERNFRGQIFEGDASLASDPCVLRDGSLWRMVYTCVAGADVGGLCQVTSADGIAWKPAASIDPAIDGLIARGRPGTGWDENMETCSLVREQGELAVYYSGYANLDAKGNRPAAALGRLASADGVHFTRSPSTPVLQPTPGGRDGDDIFSASIVPDSNLALIYVGWCIDGYHDGQPCRFGQAIQLLAATRETDGRWVKRESPVLAPRADLAWLRDGVAEPYLARGPDGLYYLFFTGSLADGAARSTGLAISDQPFGPWDVQPEPILQGEARKADACGAFAPSVVFDGNLARMWYLALDDCNGSCPSCEHEKCGCAPRYSIGYAEASLTR